MQPVAAHQHADNGGHRRREEHPQQRADLPADQQAADLAADKQHHDDDHRVQLHAVPDDHGHDEFALGKMQEGKESQHSQPHAEPFGHQRQQHDRNAPDNRPDDGNGARQPGHHAQNDGVSDLQQRQAGPDHHTGQKAEDELPDHEGAHDPVELPKDAQRLGDTRTRQQRHELMLELAPVNQKIEGQHRQEHNVYDIFEAFQHVLARLGGDGGDVVEEVRFVYLLLHFVGARPGGGMLVVPIKDPFFGLYGLPAAGGAGGGAELGHERRYDQPGALPDHQDRK